MKIKETAAVATLAAALVAAATACSSGASSAAPPQTPSSPQQPPGGPFTADIVSCDAQAQPDGTLAPLAVVKVYNDSNSLTATPDMQVKFLGGSAVLGDNLNSMGDAGSLSPGQSETVDVWGIDGGGNPMPTAGTTCQPDTYWAVPADGAGPQEGPYSW